LKEFQHNNSGIRPKRVCYIGRLCKEKGIEIVIDAFLKADIKGSELIIAGNILNFSPYKEYYGQLKEKLNQLRDNRIKLIVNPPRHEIIDLYYSSRCFADFLPMESFGLCPLEAMAAGTPPIVADEGGQRETVIHGITGFRINPKSNNVSDQMAKFIRLLLTDDRVFNIMSVKARRRAAEFDRSSFVKKWIKILESV
jgi:glycosyltransferase involved in cell wall biosynthesis